MCLIWRKNMKNKMKKMICVVTASICCMLPASGYAAETTIPVAEAVQIHDHCDISDGSIGIVTGIEEDGTFYVQEVGQAARKCTNHVVSNAKTYISNPIYYKNNATYCYWVKIRTTGKCKKCGESITTSSRVSKKHVYKNGKCTGCGRKQPK